MSKDTKNECQDDNRASYNYIDDALNIGGGHTVTLSFRNAKAPLRLRASSSGSRRRSGSGCGNTGTVTAVTAAP